MRSRIQSLFRSFKDHRVLAMATTFRNLLTIPLLDLGAAIGCTFAIDCFQA